jgi:uncharacterized damage-inducible protein DinB
MRFTTSSYGISSKTLHFVDHARKAITAIPDADLEKSLDWFGGKNTQRGVLLFIVRHAAEHVGQSIAYARFIGIVPPWTEDMQKKQPEKKEAPAK